MSCVCGTILLTKLDSAHYLGYSSDVSRSFFLPNDATLTAYLRNPTRLFRDSRPVPDLEKYMIWNLVFTAQAMSIAAMTPGSSASSVDGRARSIIEYRGYGQYFTHRVGHGLGIKGMQVIGPQSTRASSLICNCSSRTTVPPQGECSATPCWHGHHV